MLSWTQPEAPEQTLGSPTLALAAQICGFSEPGSMLELASVPLPETRDRTWNVIRTNRGHGGAGTPLQPAVPMQPCTCRGQSITGVRSSLGPWHLRCPFLAATAPVASGSPPNSASAGHACMNNWLDVVPWAAGTAHRLSSPTYSLELPLPPSS